MSGEGLIAEPRAVHGVAGHARLKELMHRGTEFLGCDVAIMGGAMSWVSRAQPRLRHLQCRRVRRDRLRRDEPRTARHRDRRDQDAHRPAVRRQPHHHAPAAERADRRLRQASRSAMSCSPAGFRRAARSSGSRRSGAKLICFAPALALAKKLMRSGADALVIEGMEAGGHIGPVSTSRAGAGNPARTSAKDIPVFVAGGIGRGEAIAAYLEMGAVGVQLGTRFVCANEMHRPRQFQEGVHPRLGPRRDSRRSRSTRACRSSRCARSRTRRW